jgi:hypothetical protein
VADSGSVGISWRKKGLAGVYWSLMQDELPIEKIR